MGPPQRFAAGLCKQAGRSQARPACESPSAHNFMQIGVAKYDSDESIARRRDARVARATHSPAAHLVSAGGPCLAHDKKAERAIDAGDADGGHRTARDHLAAVEDRNARSSDIESAFEVGQRGHQRDKHSDRVTRGGEICIAAQTPWRVRRSSGRPSRGRWPCS